jgi:hypothetical protein
VFSLFYMTNIYRDEVTVDYRGAITPPKDLWPPLPRPLSTTDHKSTTGHFIGSPRVRSLQRGLIKSSGFSLSSPHYHPQIAAHPSFAGGASGSSLYFIRIIHAVDDRIGKMVVNLQTNESAVRLSLARFFKVVIDAVEGRKESEPSTFVKRDIFAYPSRVLC